MVRPLLLLLALGACEADIGSGVYFCGPERACPPGLGCDDATAVCVFPDEVRPFTCGDGANEYEPDDDLAAAGDLGVAGCGAVSVNERMCIDELDDVDHFAIVTPPSCDGVLDVEVRYPVAFAPLALELVDDGGDVIATAEVCDELDDGGEARLCATASVSPDQRVVVRVDAAAGGPDCDGSCGYNRYQLSIF